MKKLYNKEQGIYRESILITQKSVQNNNTTEGKEGTDPIKSRVN